MHGIALAVGASRMFGLRSYRVAVAATVVAIVPFGPSFMISVPFGHMGADSAVKGRRAGRVCWGI